MIRRAYWKKKKAIFFPVLIRQSHNNLGKEQTDANIQMRRRALNKINKKDGSYLIVTYPGSSNHEKVVTKKNLEAKHTFDSSK